MIVIFTASSNGHCGHLHSKGEETSFLHWFVNAWCSGWKTTSENCFNHWVAVWPVVIATIVLHMVVLCLSFLPSKLWDLWGVVCNPTIKRSNLCFTCSPPRLPQIWNFYFSVIFLVIFGRFLCYWFEWLFDTFFVSLWDPWNLYKPCLEPKILFSCFHAPKLSLFWSRSWSLLEFYDTWETYLGFAFNQFPTRTLKSTSHENLLSKPQFERVFKSGGQDLIFWRWIFVDTFTSSLGRCVQNFNLVGLCFMKFLLFLLLFSLLLKSSKIMGAGLQN